MQQYILRLNATQAERSKPGQVPAAVILANNRAQLMVANESRCGAKTRPGFLSETKAGRVVADSGHDNLYLKLV
jgi:hypothetical protein